MQSASTYTHKPVLKAPKTLINTTTLQLNTPKLVKGVATCAHIISNRITSESKMIPLRIVFGIENLGTFEHIFHAHDVIVGGIKIDIEFLRHQGVSSLNGCMFEQLCITSREHPQASWETHTVELGDWFNLSLTNIHQRLDRASGQSFKDNRGRAVYHASYCYIVKDTLCTVSMPF